MKKIPVLSLTDTLTDITAGDNEVQIGGLNTTDPRFASYTSYSGCISSNFYIIVYKNIFTIGGIHSGVGIQVPRI